MIEKKYGKNIIIGNTFSINNRKYCNVKCSWCGKEFTTQLRYAKKGKGCLCKDDYSKIIGKKFGKLKVIRIISNKIECKCDCGNVKVFGKFNVLYGSSKSCGCSRHEKLMKRNIKHNQSKTRIYYIYMGIKRRCFNPSSYAYKWYGEKGITLCAEWLDKENGFATFYNWAINNGYNEKLSIERIDVNGNYEPSNCTWIPVRNQILNTSRSIKITSDDKVFTVSELAEKYNIPKSTIYSRIRKLNKKDLKESEVIWER